MDRSAVVRARRTIGVPEILVRGDRLRRAEIPANLGGISRGRQEAQGEGPAIGSSGQTQLRRPADLCLSVSLVMGRQGGRSGRQDGGAELEGDGRFGRVRRWLLERRL